MTRVHTQLYSSVTAVLVLQVPYFQCVRDGVLLAELSASLNPEKLANLRKALAMVRARQVINA